MAKKHKRRKTRKGRKSTQHIHKRGAGAFFTLIENPLQGASPEDLAKIRTEVGVAARKKLEESITALCKLLSETTPHLLLSNVSLYGLTAGMSDDGEKSPLGSAQQAHVEILQALALSIPPEERKSGMYVPQHTQEAFDLLKQMAEAYLMLDLDKVPDVASEQQKESLLILKQLRFHTFGIRNWAYFHHAIDIVSRLVAPLNDDIKRLCGIRGTELTAFINNLVKDMERQATDRHRRLRPIFKAKNMPDAVRAYYKEYQPAEKDPELDIEEFKKMGVDLKSVQFLLLSHSELFSDEMFTHTTAELAAFAGPDVTIEDIRLFLDRISLGFGELVGANIEHLFLANPIWSKPVIRFGEDMWFIPIPAMLSSFVFTLLDDIFKSEDAARARYSNRRATFLEQEVVSELSSVLAGAQTYTNVKWIDPGSGNEYETDLLLKLDDLLIVAESKSHRITEKALRGTPERVKTKIEELIEKPSLQSARLAGLLRDRPQNVQLRDEHGRTIPIDLTRKHRVLRLSVILEDFGTLQSSARALMDAGLLDTDIDLAPTMLLADFRVVCEILDTPGLFIHYLWRRGHFSKAARMRGDELDLLALYLDTGFEIGDAEYNNVQINAVQMSAKLDKYFEAQEAGINSPKPQRQLTKWWRDIMMLVEERRMRQWCDVLIALLCLPVEMQRSMEKKFGKLKQDVKDKWKLPNHINTLTTQVGPRGEPFGLALVAFTNGNAKDRAAIAQNAAWNAIGESPAKWAVAVGQNVSREKEGYPYSLLIALEPGKESDQQNTEQKPQNVE